MLLPIPAALLFVFLVTAQYVSQGYQAIPDNDWWIVVAGEAAIVGVAVLIVVGIAVVCSGPMTSLRKRRRDYDEEDYDDRDYDDRDRDGGSRWDERRRGRSREDDRRYDDEDDDRDRRSRDRRYDDDEDDRDRRSRDRRYREDDY
jgi:hypothetical protein